MSTTNVIPFSLRSLHPVANPALAPSPPVDSERGEIDRRAWLPDDIPNTITAPSPTELEAARYYRIDYYRFDHLLAVCGSLPRVQAALDEYDRQQAVS